MANGRIEIHDPISDDLNGDVTKPQMNSEPMMTSDPSDTLEFRIVMAYAKRRRPKKPTNKETVPVPQNVNNDPTPQLIEHSEGRAERKDIKGKKRKIRGWKHVKKLFSCTTPQTTLVDEEECPQIPLRQPEDRSGGRIVHKEEEEEEEEEQEEDWMQEVAGRLAEISVEIPFSRPEIEPDSPEEPDDVERVIGLLLRDAGDRLNDEELQRAITAAGISWSYGFFNTLIRTLLRRMGLWTDPESPGPQASPKTQIAVTCEVATRLTAAHTLPMNRMLHHAARYLQDHYASWAREQGGYEEAFHSDDDDADDE